MTCLLLKKELSVVSKTVAMKCCTISLLLLFSGFYSNAQRPQQTILKVLFVGNSLTYTNQLPELVKELGEQDGLEIKYTSLSFPNYALEDHWNAGKLQEELDKEEYDLVIAQQGPSALPESQELLLEYCKKFRKLCDAKKTKLALYMVWPSRSRFFDLDNVIYSYTHAAKKTKSLLCPAGLAWKNAWALDSSLALYGPDNFHPGIDGSVLAALTIYAAITGKQNFDFICYDKSSWHDVISAKQLGVLKQAAIKSLRVTVN